ncbi:MAG: ATP-binding cassette domain-containing protein [Phycisphaerales bacterium]|nr:ATP-binding cassette domain-containing protein [Phycisphaerales bacterium]
MSVSARSVQSGGSTPDQAPVVLARGLSKTFRDFWMRPRARAVENVDFEIHRGEIFGLLGPNGSGKSTTIKMILGLLKKTKGRLAVFGKPATDVSSKKRIGYLPEESYLYPFLNARETLDYYAKLFQLNHRARTKRIDELLEMVGLEAVQFRQVREYSKGMQRRIGIAQALINDPEFLILDEPTSGLDPIGTRQVKDLILHLGKRGKTILLSSHLLSDVEDVVDRMVILYGGRVRAAGTCDELLAARDRSVIETGALDEPTIAELREVLQRHLGEAPVIRSGRQKLEDLFLDIVARAKAERAETSGAQAGGMTAAFLMGDGAATTASRDGKELIESLVTSHPEEQPIEVEPVPAAQAREEDVIGDLLGDAVASEADASAPSAPPAEERSTPRSAPGDVDDDVISSLLGGGGSGDGGEERGT